MAGVRLRGQVRSMRTEHARSIRLLAVGVSSVGYLLMFSILVTRGVVTAGGDGGGDTLAYWTAGRNLLAGRPLYTAGVGFYAAYLYPPVLAQVFAPLSLLPFPAVVWIWRGVQLVCLRLAVGSWTAGGLLLLVWPPLMSEIDAGNVHLVIAAAVGMAIRGRPEGVVLAALTKFASLAALPLAFVTERRRLVAGTVGAGVIVIASVVAAPHAWLDYAQAMMTPLPSSPSWYNLGAALPLPLRLAAAGLTSVGAIRWPRLAAVSATLLLPILWVHGLSVLVAAIATPGAMAPSRQADRGTAQAGSDGPSGPCSHTLRAQAASPANIHGTNPARTAGLPASESHRVARGINLSAGRTASSRIDAA